MHRVVQDCICLMWGFCFLNKALIQYKHMITNDNIDIMAGCLSAKITHQEFDLIDKNMNNSFVSPCPFPCWALELSGQRHAMVL